MTEYIIVAKQRGYGCDYTIGCGVKTFFISAETNEELQSKIDEIIEDHSFYDDSETALESFILYELTGDSIEMDPTSFVREDKEEVDEEERALYLKLKPKYG